MKEATRTLREFLVVGVLGLVVGLIANTANPKGLSLTRNYYPKLPKVITTQPRIDTQPGDGNQTRSTTQPSPPPPNGNGKEMPEEEILEHLRDAGFQGITHREMVETYESPYRKDGLYMIIDARNENFYKEGHIPGAYHLDYYYADDYIDTVMKAYNLAEGVEALKIAVYCNGGKCEDSELTVGYLLTKGIPPHKVFIYGRGFTGWKAEGMPIETGERNSGNIVQTKPSNGGQTTKGAAK